MPNKNQLVVELRDYITAEMNMEPLRSGSETDDDQEINQEETMEEKTSQEELKQTAEELTGCQECRLAENRARIVFGQGDTSARVMVVGEAPGAREDEQGLPFVGPSGKLLRGGFEKVGLEEEDIYITNVVKCRPPDNRDPKTEELKSCRPVLDRQLELIDPEVILTVGNFGLRYFLGEDKNITSARGDVYTWENRPLVPTYHPGYILRNRTRADSFVRDLQLAADQLK